jgi:arylsulfatase A-like enzyme
MNKTLAPSALVVLISFCPLALSTGNPLSAQQPPNVVVFLADDAGWGDFSQNGNTQLATPHIDSIATQGVTLDRFFVCPVCAPTRAEFLTGKYHPSTGVYGVSTGQERLNLGESTIAQSFKNAGYATGAFGKWHNGSQWPYHPMARGFDEFFGYTSGHWGEYFDPPLEHNAKPVRAKGYIVDACTSQALDFIDNHRERPFFCYIPFTTPHSPWAVPQEDWMRFKDKPITQRGTLPKQEDLDQTRCALAMMENQDRNVGRVLERLKQLNLDRKTIVVYFSDNGPNTSRWNGGMKGRKGNVDEGGVRSTCFIRWPDKLPAGHVVPEIAAAIDLRPTLIALAGLSSKGEPAFDGIDLSARLRGDDDNLPPRTIFTHWAGAVSARTQTHRLDANGKLFDMVADPNQSMHLVEDANDERLRLLALVEQWRAKQGLIPSANEANAKRQGSKGNQVDPRPVPVGFREFPRTWLPARDATPHGSVKRSSSAPNCSYFVDWSSTEDRIVWEVSVETTGTYEVEVHYTCAEGDQGAVIELGHHAKQDQPAASPPLESVAAENLAFEIKESFDPPLYANQDTLPRPPAESPMKEFKVLRAGTVNLPKGDAKLVLRAIKIAGEEAINLRGIALTLVK